MSSRGIVLRRVREALGRRGPAGREDDDPRPGGVPPTIGGDYRRSGDLAAPELAVLFAERIGEYRVTVRRVDESELPASIANELAAVGAAVVTGPPDLPPDWRQADVDWRLDSDGQGGSGVLATHELDACDAVVTGCALAVAETGTILFDGGERQGRRALTLLPDVHICVVYESQIVQTVPEAVAATSEAVRAGAPITLVSGPSATSDIELDRVEGVHGPRTLVVVLTR